MLRIALATALLFGSLHTLSAGTLTKTGSLVTPRDYATATLLPDGRVLVAGGTSASLEIVDWQTATSTLVTGRTTLPLTRHSATLLADGRVVLAGGGYRTDGRPPFGHYGDREVRTYGGGEAVAIAAEMASERLFHRATLLDDGRVLISGGYNADLGGTHYYRNDVLAAEIFDPVTNAVRTIAGMPAPRTGHTATRLRDGRVLIAGGANNVNGALASAELFDPVTETFTPIASMNAARVNHTATLLDDGRVLITGGADIWYATGELFDPATRSFTSLETDLGARRGHTATLLRNGTVLIAGGIDDAIVYDPHRDTILERLPIPGAALQFHDAVLLADGSVLIAGGARDHNPSADIFRYKRTTLRPRAVR